jgi:excisionase family DNA binding protein
MAKHLTTRQVAEIFHVHPNTVVAWANAGRLPAIRTAGNHRRFDPEAVEALRQQLQSGAATAERQSA